jgi:hypothetical protein
MVDIEEILYVEQNALIAEFPPNMELEDEVFARVNERFEELAQQSHIDTHISILKMDNPMNSDVFSRAQEAAEAGTEYGITTWITVSDGIKKMALGSQVEEIDGVETTSAETKAEALELAAE